MQICKTLAYLVFMRKHLQVCAIWILWTGYYFVRLSGDAPQTSCIYFVAVISMWACVCLCCHYWFLSICILVAFAHISRKVYINILSAAFFCFFFACRFWHEKYLFDILRKFNLRLRLAACYSAVKAKKSSIRKTILKRRKAKVLWFIFLFVCLVKC